jgi:hypothetical protein
MFRNRELQIALVVGICGGCAEGPVGPDLILEVDDQDCRPEAACSYSFEAISIGDRTAHAFLLTNHGDTAATVDAVEISGDPSFSLTQSPDGTIEPQSTEPIVVFLSPNTAAELNGTLLISAVDPPARIELALRAIAESADPEITTEGCDFGDVPIGTTAAGCTVTVRNSTAREVEITGVSVPEPFASSATIIIPAFIDPSEQLSIPISVTPTALGRVDATFSVSFGPSMFTVSLSVIGT